MLPVTPPVVPEPNTPYPPDQPGPETEEPLQPWVEPGTPNQEEPESPGRPQPYAPPPGNTEREGA